MYDNLPHIHMVDGSKLKTENIKIKEPVLTLNWPKLAWFKDRWNGYSSVLSFVMVLSV